MKICYTCKVKKDLSEYYIRKSGTIYSNCKKCCQDYTNKWIKSTGYLKNKKYKYQKKYNKQYSKGKNGKKLQWHKQLKYNYGLSESEYNQLFNNQNGKCFICQKHQDNFKNKLAVDHCHKTNRIRGLLCTNCNTGLGNFKDSEQLLIKAIKYLKG